MDAGAQASINHCEDLAFSAFGGGPARRTRDIALYLAHVGCGASMRALARASSRPPSTILRTVRRVEALRDDPLLDRTIGALEVEARPCSRDQMQTRVAYMQVNKVKYSTHVGKTDISALERLSEPGAFLLVARGAEKAGVFCPKNQFRRPLALISAETASRYLANDWVALMSQSNLSSKYMLSRAGKAMLKRRAVGAEAPRQPHGFAEGPSIFAGQHQLPGDRRIANPATGQIETVRVNLGESPLGWLAKRRDAKGEPLLSADEVEAGERLREDFELAQIGPKVGQDWRRFLTPASKSSGPGRTPSEGPMFARERVASALGVLGPGLEDVAIRVCCFLEGLEATEKRMGWSARSGKVVLKLALQRLVAHYGSGGRAAAA